MRLPILEIKRSDGPAALARHRLARSELALSREMESAVGALPRQAPLNDCHRAVSAVGAKHGLGRAQSVALWTRAALRVFEADASEHPPVEVNRRVENLVTFAFAHAGPKIQSAGGLSPFLVTAGDGPPDLREFAHGLPAFVLADARAAAAALPPAARAYALALVGQINPRNPRSTTRTLYVEAAERGAPAGHLFARDYKPLTPVGPFEFVGPPERVGAAASLFWR
jgi:hypothetical protein